MLGDAAIAEKSAAARLPIKCNATPSKRWPIQQPIVMLLHYDIIIRGGFQAKLPKPCQAPQAQRATAQGDRCLRHVPAKYIFKKQIVAAIKVKSWAQRVRNWARKVTNSANYLQVNDEYG